MMHLSIFHMTTYPTSLSIKSWAQEDRPREKLLNKGKASLSDTELIAILLGSGTKRYSAVELARQILALADNNLVQLGQLSINKIMQIKGIGEAKAVSLYSALELGRRRQKQEALTRINITSSKQAYTLLSPCIADLSHEEFWAILLNRKGDVLKYKCLTTGGFSSTVVDPRQIFSWALSENASRIILAHNHPDSTLFPSEQDIQITKTLIEAGKFLNILIQDHIIVTDRGFFSFSDKGLI